MTCSCHQRRWLLDFYKASCRPRSISHISSTSVHPYVDQLQRMPTLTATPTPVHSLMTRHGVRWATTDVFSQHSSTSTPAGPSSRSPIRYALRRGSAMEGRRRSPWRTPRGVASSLGSARPHRVPLARGRSRSSWLPCACRSSSGIRRKARRPPKRAYDYSTRPIQLDRPRRRGTESRADRLGRLPGRPRAPARAGRLPDEGPQGRRDLRRQGLKLPDRVSQLLRPVDRPGPPKQPARRGHTFDFLDLRGRVGGAAHREPADQGHQAQVQRPPDRRQDVPLPRRHQREDYPRVFVTRNPTGVDDKTGEQDPLFKGARIFGPFTNAGALREAVQVLQRVFKFRTCKLDIVEGDPRTNASARACSRASGSAPRRATRASASRRTARTSTGSPSSWAPSAPRCSAR
jgi:hypothetical protein